MATPNKPSLKAARRSTLCPMDDDDYKMVIHVVGTQFLKNARTILSNKSAISCQGKISRRTIFALPGRERHDLSEQA